VAPRKLHNCQNSFRVESKMAEYVQIFNIRAPISIEELKLVETSNLVCALTMRSNFDGMQKLGQRGHDPV